MHSLAFTFPTWASQSVVRRKFGPTRRVKIMRKVDPARWVTFLAEPTFCFSCKQFATYVKRLVVQGSSARRVILTPGTTFLYINRALAVILLQIVMVSPGTHLVKKHESLSITSESQLKKKTRSPKLKMLWPLCNQTVGTDDKTLYYSLLKLKYSPSIHLKQ